MAKLWVTDDELIEESGVPKDKMRCVLDYLDRQPLSGFPKKNPLYGNRRYFPAVLEYWRVTNPVAEPRAAAQYSRKSA
jgi:hypothetical protein